MERDKNSSAKTPNGFTVGIDSTHVPSANVPGRAAPSGIGSVKNLRLVRGHRLDPIARAIFVL